LGVVDSTGEELTAPTGNAEAPMPPTDLDNLRSLLLDPEADPLDVGLVLAALTPNDMRALGHESLTDLLQDDLLVGVRRPEYTTVMRWVRAASVLEGPDDPRREWGMSRLGELARLPEGERERFVEGCGGPGPADMNVLELRAAIGRFGARRRRQSPGDRSQAVLERAIQIALGVRGPDAPPATVKVTRSAAGTPGVTFALTTGPSDAAAADALATAARVVDAIAVAKSAWRRVRPDDVAVPPPMPLVEILELPPGQLEARWLSPHVVQVLKAGTPILHLPVERVSRSGDGLVQPQGTTKTEGAFGVIDSIIHGCLRAAVGLPRCDEACFTIPDERTASCYANWTRHANRMRAIDPTWDVSRNGLVNPHIHIRLPSDGRPDLSRYRRQLWRMDAESADGAMSLGLGIVQAWAERNPAKRFLTICSHHVRPSDEMLAWAAALGNLWVGTTLSGWFDRSESDIRLESLARLLRFGVPSVAFVVTHWYWSKRSQEIAREAVSLLSPDRVIEVPYRTGVARQETPELEVNPLGACSDHRVGPFGRSYHVVRGTSEWGRWSHLVDDDGRPPTGRTHSRCEGCRLMCGVHVLDAHPESP